MLVVADHALLKNVTVRLALINIGQQKRWYALGRQSIAKALAAGNACDLAGHFTDRMIWRLFGSMICSQAIV